LQKRVDLASVNSRPDKIALKQKLFSLGNKIYQALVMAARVKATGRTRGRLGISGPCREKELTIFFRGTTDEEEPNFRRDLGEAEKENWTYSTAGSGSKKASSKNKSKIKSSFTFGRR